MNPKKILILLLALVIAGVLAVFVGARILGPKLISVAAPTGDPIGEFDVPRSETSVLAVNIVLPMTLLDEIANTQTPEVFQGSEVKDFQKNIRNGSFAWDVVRGDIQFQNNGTGLTFSVPFEGAAQVRGDVDMKIISFPVNGNVEIGGIAGGTLAPQVMPDWTINPNFTPAMTLDKATIGLGQLGKIEIGEVLGGSLGGFLQKEAAKLTPTLRKSIDLRGEVSKLWEQAYLSKSVSDDPPVWVNVTPRRLLLGPIDYSQPDQLSVMVGIQSETYVTNREPLISEIAPLPELGILEGPGGTDLLIPVIISVSELNEVLKTETLDVDTGIGTGIEMSGLEARVGQNGLLDLKVEIEAGQSRIGRKIAGSIWVSGRPIINYDEMTLGFSEVALTVETRDKLAGAAAWLLEGLLVKGIESQLRVDLNDYKAELNEEVQEAIAEADLPEGIDVSFQNLNLSLSDVYTITRHSSDGEPDPGIVIVVRATGDMSTRINQVELKPAKVP